MNINPRKFTLADEDYYPSNMTKKEVKNRFNKKVVTAEDVPGPFTPTTIPQIDHIVQDLIQYIRIPIRFTAKRFKPIKGAILYGAPGTGKTTILKSLKQECSRYLAAKIAFFDVKLAVILDGDVRNNLMKAYDAADALKPSVIFIDEINGLLQQKTSQRVEETLLCILDGSESLDSVFTVGATNDISSVSDALRRKGRLEILYELTLPSSHERQLWLKLLTAPWNLTTALLSDIAGDTDGFSPTDLVALCRDAEVNAYKRLNPSVLDKDSLKWDTSDDHVTVIAEDMHLALKDAKST